MRIATIVEVREEEVGERRNRRAVAGDLVALLGEHARAQLGIAHARDALGERQVRDRLVRREAHERMERRLEPEQHADAARADLAAHVEAARDGALDAREDLPPLIRRVVALHRRDRQRPTAARGRHLLEQIELGDRSARGRASCRSRSPPGARRGRARRTPAAMPASSRASTSEAGVAAPRAVRWLSLRPGREARPRRPRAPRAASARIAAMSSSVATSPATARSPITYMRSGSCGTCSEEVDRVRHRVDRVHVIGERLPAPRDALGERRAGDVLDAFHQLDERRLAARPHRREADAAAAHHARRHAVQRARRQLGVPRHLAVVVRVDVDEAGQHVRAARVDRAARRARARSPTSTIRPSCDARRRPVNAARPVPSTIVPPAILRSNTASLLHCKIDPIKTIREAHARASSVTRCPRARSRRSDRRAMPAASGSPTSACAAPRWAR